MGAAGSDIVVCIRFSGHGPKETLPSLWPDGYIRFIESDRRFTDNDLSLSTPYITSAVRLTRHGPVVIFE